MKRRVLIFFIALIALLGSLVTALASVNDRDFQLRGYVDATHDDNLPFRLPRFGVNVELTQYSSDELDHQLDLMAAAHVNWVRQMVRWDQIEPQHGEYEWNQWDEIIHVVSLHPDLNFMAVFVNTPEWAHSPQPTRNATTPPVNSADFAAFTRAFALRYGESVDYYQVWDEPNLTDAWGGREPRAADYTALLAAAYEAIHTADSSATVISAGLAPTTETGAKNISDILYLQDMYALGAKAYMDGVGAKPYGFNLSPEDRSVSPNVLNFSRIIALREEMVSNGDGAKALWASNWGWNSLPENWAGQPSIWGSVTSADQIVYTLDALDRAEREWPWLAGMILQQWQPDASLDDPQWGFALIDSTNAPTRLWHALAERLRPNTAENGLFPAANHYTHYSGVWKFGALGADIGWVQDSQFDFSFTGTSVSLLLRQDNYTAYLYPTIDGQQANAPPHDASANAYIILTSGSLLPETNLVPVGINLSVGNHTLHVTADRGWDHWAIAGFTVSSGDLAEPHNRQITVAWLVTAVAALTTIVAGWRLHWTSLFKPLSAFQQRVSITGHLIIGVISSLALLIGMVLTWGDSLPQLFRRDTIPLGLAVATLGLIKLQPGIILTLAAAAVLLAVFYSRLDIGLTFTIFCAPFFLFPVQLYNYAFPLAEVMLLLTTAAWLLRLLAEWQRRFQSSVSQFPFTYPRWNLSALDFGASLWVVLGLVSLLWTVRQGQAITELRVMIIEPVLFYMIFRTAQLDRKSVVRVIDALLLAGIVVAVIGLWQFVHGQAVVMAEGGAQRLASVYGSPNNVGLFLGRCIPFVIAFLFVGVDSRRRILAAVALVPLGLALVLSQSVGAIFIGVPAAFITVVLLTFRKRARLVLLAFVVVAVIAFIIALEFPRFARVLDFTSGTNLYRIRVWQSALNVIHDHPITGLGLDQFLYAFRGGYIMPDAWQEPNLSHPHNIVLDFWVCLGLAGVGLLIWLQVAFWRRARLLYAFHRGTDPLLTAIVIGAVGSMVDLLAHGLIDNSVYVQDLAYVFILLLALLASLPNTRAIDEPVI